MSELSLGLSSHLAPPALPPSAGLVETAQPIRTMAIRLEDGALEEGGEGGGCERQSKEEGVEEAEEQLEVTPDPFTTTHFDYLHFEKPLHILGK